MPLAYKGMRLRAFKGCRFAMLDCSKDERLQLLLLLLMQPCRRWAIATVVAAVAATYKVHARSNLCIAQCR
eukprot:3121188-Alexandrium_andersonii.AAC.1